MYFLIDSKDQEVTAHKNNGLAARSALNKLNITPPAGADPVKAANDVMGDRMAILNISGAFDAISNSDDRAAQELAGDFKRAVDGLYR